MATKKTETAEDHTAGLKFDGDKLRWDLLMPMQEDLRGVVKVLTFGQRKYKAHNWMFVRPFVPRYYAAFKRHLDAIMDGEQIDPETGLMHWWHLITNAFFLAWATRKGVWDREIGMLAEMEAEAAAREISLEELLKM